MYRREDEPLRRLLLDEAGRAELDRLWSELEFVSEQALATPIAYEGLVQYYRKPNDGARIMFFTSQLAYLCGRMAEVKEGDRTLLDNTAIMHCSSMLHGNHDSRQLPIVLLGGAGGKLRRGRVLDYLDAPNRRMCSRFLSLMEWGGLELDRFGDSTERLTGI